jgi:hypothetical protein
MSLLHDPLLTVYPARVENFDLLLEEPAERDGEGDSDEVVHVKQRVQQRDATRNGEAGTTEKHVYAWALRDTLRQLSRPS